MELDSDCKETLPYVKTLISLHSHEIKSLRSLCGSDFKSQTDNPSCTDDLFLLRFVLSYNGDLERAAEAVNNAVAWRQKHHAFVQSVMDKPEGIDDILTFPPRMAPYLEPIKKLLVAWSHKTTRLGQSVVLIRLTCCNFSALMEIVPVDVIRDYVIYSNEVEFWWCDRQTRLTGKIHKCYRLVDLDGISTKTLDRKFLKIFGSSSKLAEFLHPQLVAKTVLLNAPSFIRWIVEALKAVGVSKRALEKLWVHRRQPNLSLADHPDLTTLIAREDLPSYIGGDCECETGCVPNFPNDRQEPPVIDIALMKETVLKERQEILNRHNQEVLKQVCSTKPYMLCA